MGKVYSFFCLFIISLLMVINCYADSDNINLNTGWNLSSLSLQPADTNITSVLESISGKYLSVWAYMDGSWRAYDPNSPGFSDLTTMEAGKGYWLNMTEAATLTVSGSTPSNSIELVKSWNLVGYNSQTAKPIADCMSSIEGRYDSVSTYDPYEETWLQYVPDALPFLSNLEFMQPGRGYWLYAKEECVWDVGP